MNLAGMIGEAAAVAATDAVRLARLGELSDIGQVEQYVGAALTKFMEQQGPAIADKLAVYLQPATQKAVEVIKPSVMEALKEYTPTFAAVAGAMVGVSVLVGTWLARREFRKSRGRRVA